MNQFIAFYGKHKISPVSQDIHDLSKHFSRRQSLYRQLGILPALVRGRSVLEIGPGSGFNSLFTAALQPARYCLVEGNPTGVERTEQLLSSHGLLSPDCFVVPSLIEDFETDEKFGLVLCEGMLPNLPNPAQTLMQVASFVDDDGVLVITCNDEVSDFAESLRYLYAQAVIDPAASLDAQVDLLMPLISPHLAHLPGMSRPHRDWIIDNLLNPAAIGKVLPIPTAIETLQPEFEFYASSPHFFTDWRWYKDVAGDNRQLNARGIEEYWQNVHNLLNHTRVLPPREIQSNQRLMAACVSIRQQICEFVASRATAHLPLIAVEIESLAGLMDDFCTETGAALRQFVAVLRQLPGDPRGLMNADKFAPLFGRGQQYVSFTKAEVLPNLCGSLPFIAPARRVALRESEGSSYSGPFES